MLVHGLHRQPLVAFDRLNQPQVLMPARKREDDKRSADSAADEDWFDNGASLRVNLQQYCADKKLARRRILRLCLALPTVSQEAGDKMEDNSTELFCQAKP